ncbi:hypothetical protein [Robertmurraya andreesenii]|uniref:RNA polymerase subunit sigma n=1 Tax=Anoxybacillus andreesenii TaxID=1325932 RepID=A0ABT9V755_9BACL|nr:hypothetical protein [Robertmurraya andreesenii]MDQ0156788.1 hypothetical protein [Robertmurraya andreesenii]
MSLKAIEMQIALPRTQDIGKLQEQLQQRGQLQQDFATETVKKEEDKKKSTVVKQERKDEAHFHKDGHHRDDKEQKGRKKDGQEHQQRTELHPYKGTKVDISG